MKTRLYHWWQVLTSGYWFVPSVMSALAVVLAVALMYLDEYHLREGWVGWLYPGGTEGARSVLATVASSVITVAGVVFSITIATLTQASSQFGPRMLRNFMRDLGNQLVLGTFVATYVYCLLVLRTIGRAGDGAAVPHAAVMGAVASIAVLIYFIHHVSLSLQAPIIVANVATDLERALRRAFPADLGHGPKGPAAESGAPTLPAAPNGPGATVTAPKDGYLQAIDQEGLLDLAVRHDLVVTLDVRPGDYLIAGNPVTRAYPTERCPPAVAEALGALLMCGRQRTPEQDVEFAIRQLAEVAVRALSPGVNDPYTAINCIDRLSSALVTLEHEDLHGSYRYDAAGNLRVVARVATFKSYVDAAFNEIRQYGKDSVGVTVRLLEAIAATAVQMRHEPHRRELLRQAEMIYSQARRSIEEPGDLADVAARYTAAVEALTGPRPGDGK